MPKLNKIPRQPDKAKADATVVAVVKRPAKSARIALWVEYAGSLGLHIDGFTKDEIIDTVDNG